MIDPKLKPCKGQGKAKDFQGCGELTMYRTYGLGQGCGCYRNWLLNTPEGKKQVDKITIKATKVVKKETDRKSRKETRAMREGLLTHNDYVQLLQKVFNTYIRLRDKGDPCISCDTPAESNIKWDAGHFYPTTYGYLRFNEDNVNKQCSNNCNLHKSGNFQEYAPRLEEKIGVDRMQKLHNDRHKTIKRSIPEIKDKIKEYKAKIKQLK